MVIPNLGNFNNQIIRKQLYFVQKKQTVDNVEF